MCQGSQLSSGDSGGSSDEGSFRESWWAGVREPSTGGSSPGSVCSLRKELQLEVPGSVRLGPFTRPEPDTCSSRSGALEVRDPGEEEGAPGRVGCDLSLHSRRTAHCSAASRGCGQPATIAQVVAGSRPAGMLGLTGRAVYCGPPATIAHVAAGSRPAGMLGRIGIARSLLNAGIVARPVSQARVTVRPAAAASADHASPAAGAPMPPMPGHTHGPKKSCADECPALGGMGGARRKHYDVLFFQ